MEVRGIRSSNAIIIGTGRTWDMSSVVTSSTGSRPAVEVIAASDKDLGRLLCGVCAALFGGAFEHVQDDLQCFCEHCVKPWLHDSRLRVQ